MLRQENPEIARLTGLVFERLVSASKGDVIPWPELEQLLGVDRDWSNPLWTQPVTKARLRLLKERNVATWTEDGAALRILTDEEVARDQVRRRLRRSSNQCKRGLREAKTVNFDGLPMHERRLLSFGIDAMDANRKANAAATRQWHDRESRPRPPISTE